MRQTYRHLFKQMGLGLERSRYKGRGANALALGAEEGRGKLRKAGSRRKQSMIPGYPNEGTHIR